MSAARVTPAGLGSRYGHRRAIDILMEERDAGEMSRGPALLRHPVGGGLGGACGVVRALRRSDAVEQAAAIERLEGRRRQTAKPEWQRLQGRGWIARLLQNNPGASCEAQFTGQEESDRAGASDDDIMGVLVVWHGMLLGRLSSTGAFHDWRPQRTNDWARSKSVRVRRGDLRHEAKDQSFRHRKDLGSPDQVCLFRHWKYSGVAFGPQPPLPERRYAAAGSTAAADRGHEAKLLKLMVSAQGLEPWTP